VTDSGFDACLLPTVSPREKARTHPLRLAGLIGNRTAKRDLIEKICGSCADAGAGSFTFD